MDLKLYFLFFVSLLQLTLFAFLLLTGRKKLVIYLCSFWIVSVALWTFGMMMYMQDPREYTSIVFWTRVLYFAGFLSSIAFFLFALSYTRRQLSKTVIVLSGIAAFGIGFFLFFTNDIISGVQFLTHNRKVIQEGMYPLYFALFFFFYLSSIFTLFRYYGRTKGIIKKQLQYIFLGLLPPLSFSAVVNMILPALFGDFTYAWMGPLTSIIMLGGITYAISKHRFLDVELSLHRFLSRLSISFVFLSPILPILFVQGIYRFVFSFLMLPFALSIWIYRKKISQSIEQVWNYLFYRSNRNSLDLIHEAKDQFAFSIQNALDILKKAFQVQEISFVYSNDAVHFEPLVGRKNLYLSSHNPLIQKLQAEPQELLKDEIEYLITQEEDSELELLQKLKQEMDELFISAAFPLTEETPQGKRKLIGIVFLSEKIDKKLFSQQLLEEMKLMLKDVTFYLSTASTKEQIEKRLRDEKKVQQEFVKGLLHEVNTPLVYSKNLSMLVDWIKKDPENTKYLHEAEEGVDKVTKMIARISEVISWQVGAVPLEKAFVPLQTLLKATLAEVKHYRKSIIVKRSDYWKMKVRIDVKQMVRALKEIIENAFFFTVPERKPKLIISVHKEAFILRLEFFDNGKGIDREQWHYIFAPLYVIAQSRNRSECGIGCGLTLAQGIVKAHNGRIYVAESQLRQGTRMVVEIPLN